MGNDPQQEEVLPLGNANVVFQHGDKTRRFRVYAATLKLLPGARRVRIGFEGPKGLLAIEIPKVAFWRVTALFHERSIAADDAGRKQPARRTRGKRS